MKNIFQKIKEQTISSITKGCIAAICIYGSEKTQLTSPSGRVQTDNFSNRENNADRREMALEIGDHAGKTEVLLEMMEYNEAHWV